ncbi:D-alanyl-D-alanine carboxypeptidase family protein [Corynebacterium sp. TAE3-ERU16]|uniref:D-alanyl-D-alanine carboxypeptidase family protein n=1 Tax=Corynebacterium sp. TAE3-ERU16 TaxID=2849493 RepID=UPI001C45CA4B|nr:D-alanyl-D-alanine carboxypeptidase family protein [Corynebacterium sp. TAE3-ERU16]MBV7292584.1 D-alanyl-D-alanine carboxypeptidase [Corynebacterium sp. TAE3-ERU16]
MRRRLLGAVTATALLSASPFTAAAEQPDTATLTVTTTPPQTALSGRPSAPLTDGCPWATTPAEPVDASEIPTDGRPVPPPLPVAATPAGGPAMAECGVSAAPGFLVPEEQTATAWIVFDLDTGDVIAAKDPHGRYRPASIIKALLALVTLEHLPLDREVVATHDSADMEGSRVGLVEDGRYTVEQLLQGLLMASGNDAAHALAQELGGDQRTLELVNAKARELGTQDTRVADYTGLDGPGMSTSPFDLALIYREAWRNPVFARIVDTDFVDFPGGPENEGFQVWNDNHLLLNDPDGIGGKTGFTDDARHTFVGAKDVDGRRLAAIVLDTTVDRGRPWEQARRLLDAAYAVPRGTGIGSVEKLPVVSAAPSPSVTAAGSPTVTTPTRTGGDGVSGASGTRSHAWGPAAITTGVLFLVVLIAGIALNRRLAERRRARQRRR